MKNEKVNKKIVLLPLLLVILGTNFSMAAPDSARLAISIVPTNFFSQGLRFDVDRRIGISQKWLTAFAQFYIGLTNKDGDDRTGSLENQPLPDYNGDQFTGFGAGIGYKIFPHKFKYRKLSQYIQFGAEYQYFYMHYLEGAWVPGTLNGIPVYDFKTDWFNSRIQRFIPMFTMGFQLNYKSILLDGYFGDAFCIVNQQDDIKGLRNYSKGILNFSHRGSLPLAGIRLGIFLK